MDTEPDFSIITPSYNYARYVRECIESVKNQEGATFEHIIQDAGSTDGTLDILHSYPHLKLHVEKDSGMSEGINRGFRKARGKWVMWLNTDDRLLPGAGGGQGLCGFPPGCGHCVWSMEFHRAGRRDPTRHEGPALQSEHAHLVRHLSGFHRIVPAPEHYY